MTIEERIKKAQDNYDRLQIERQQHLDAATEKLTEMSKLQGEYRVLSEILEDKSKDEPQEAQTIKAIAAEED